LDSLVGLIRLDHLGSQHYGVYDKSNILLKYLKIGYVHEDLDVVLRCTVLIKTCCID